MTCEFCGTYTEAAMTHVACRFVNAGCVYAFLAGMYEESYSRVGPALALLDAWTEGNRTHDTRLWRMTGQAERAALAGLHATAEERCADPDCDLRHLEMYDLVEI